MKVFIINYNRLTLMKNMADFLYEHGLDVYIIDNNSTYLPLLDYYKETKYNVLRMDKNYGYKVFWEQKLYNNLGLNERYILTDSDLDLSQIPDNFLSILERGLDKYPQFGKCGFSLEINGLPNTEVGNGAKSWETHFWESPLDEMYFKADIDTTFALYKVNYHSLNGIRTNRPYTAKHVPWHYTDYNSLSEDEKYYLDTITTSTSWSKELKNK
jgi:hypothetical protein